MKRSQDDTCQVSCFNRLKVDEVAGQMLAAPVVERLSGTFKVLGDQTRIKLLYALSKHELCVCDLAAILGMSRSAVSHQLRVLRDSRLVKYRKAGKMAYYSLDDRHVLNLFEQGLEHVAHAYPKPD
jgi:ArsR family transcriptional regulator, lead/cadmium/zinc/bismuth-responsive transcriptional repressor